VKSRSRKKTLTVGVLLGAALLASAAIGISAAGAHSTPAKTGDRPATKAWSFGVMGDTQWTCADDPAGANPNSVPVSIINQVNAQFISMGVKFVIEPGDLTDNGSDAGIATRAAAAQPLLNAGIGYFPVRGNHETYGTSNSFAIPAFRAAFPQTQGLSKTFGATNFSSPTSVSPDLKGMSYSFDYGTPGNNARFVLLDTWVTPSKDVSAAGYDYGYSLADQQSWISSRLNASTRGTTQAFVFSHQPLIAESHQDSPFVGYTNADPAMQNAFMASLQSNDVKYYICGHDHISQRSIIASPDGQSSVQEIISASNSSKFYTPKAISDPNWFGQKVRETSVTQDMGRVGFYIYTVDGPRVTVDYYADDQGGWQSDASYPGGPSGAGSHVTPTFHFVKRATWGYSLNGKQFVVGGGATNGTDNSPSYAVVKDSFQGTSAQILSGTYANTATDYTGRVLAQTVNTGWTSGSTGDGLNSNILTLWGMTSGGLTGNVASSQTDPFALSMSGGKGQGANGLGILVAKDANGHWVNAVDLNTGAQTKRFILGPELPSDGLGTYGIDPTTRTAWAVIDYNGSYAVSDHFMSWLFPLSWGN
jgi:Calcineurin-like phosphoesterase